MNVDKAVRYHRLKRRAAIGTTLLGAAMLVTLLVTGLSARLRDLAVAAAPGASPESPDTIALYVVLLCGIWQAAAVPLAYYNSVILERRYGLSAESTRRWSVDYVKAGILSTLIAVAAAELVYLTVRRWPAFWWAGAALACGGGMLLIARAAPVALLPLFYRFKPLERPQLQARLRALSDRAGLPVLGVFVWVLGDRTRRANAALVGVGATRRVLLSDTLLADYSDDEIEVILAHELAHHAHRDVLRGVAAQTALLLAGFATAAWVIDSLNGRVLQIGLWAGPADVAALPLLLLVTGAVSIALAPLVNALSQWHERRADAFALRLTGRPEAFMSAMRRLAAQNLAEPQPSRAARWFFHSHPPIEDRIERARRFEPGYRGIAAGGGPRI